MMIEELKQKFISNLVDNLKISLISLDVELVKKSLDLLKQVGWHDSNCDMKLVLVDDLISIKSNFYGFLKLSIEDFETLNNGIFKNTVKAESRSSFKVCKTEYRFNPNNEQVKFLKECIKIFEKHGFNNEQYTDSKNIPYNVNIINYFLSPQKNQNKFSKEDLERLFNIFCHFKGNFDLTGFCAEDYKKLIKSNKENLSGLKSHEFYIFVNEHFKAYENILMDNILKGDEEQSIEDYNTNHINDPRLKNIMPFHLMEHELNPFKLNHNSVNFSLQLDKFLFGYYKETKGEKYALDMLMKSPKLSMDLFTENGFLNIIDDKSLLENNTRIKNLLENETDDIDLIKTMICCNPKKDWFKYVKKDNLPVIMMKLADEFDKFIEFDSENLKYYNDIKNTKLIFGNFKCINYANKIMDNGLVEFNEQFYEILEGLLKQMNKGQIRMVEEHNSFLKSLLISKGLRKAESNKKIKV